MRWKVIPGPLWVACAPKSVPRRPARESRAAKIDILGEKCDPKAPFWVPADPEGGPKIVIFAKKINIKYRKTRYRKASRKNVIF